MWLLEVGGWLKFLLTLGTEERGIKCVYFKKKIVLVDSVEGREWGQSESFKYNFVFYFFPINLLLSEVATNAYCP